MTRLPAEFDRLYRAEPGAPFVDAQGRVRAALLEVVQPTGWTALSPLWQGVQAELALPAPAIAVSGLDAIQLWFSLEAPIDAQEAHEFLAALRVRFLSEVPAARIRLWPDAAPPSRPLASVPALQASTGNWSAFVSPDLIGVFSDTPWLDIEPGDEGQAALLRPLRSIAPAPFAAALAQLRASASARDAQAPAAADPRAPEAPSPAGPAPEDDPRRFLLRVMNDESIAMALRIEAAKALLPSRDTEG
jgi:hypothetical protein